MVDFIAEIKSKCNWLNFARFFNHIRKSTQFEGAQPKDFLKKGMKIIAQKSLLVLELLFSLNRHFYIFQGDPHESKSIRCSNPV